MCWNAEVSLQTFVFASISFIIGLLFKFPLHKLIFFLYFSSVQLFEHFVWKNINNKNINESLSKFGYWLIAFMPVFALLLIPNSKTRFTSISLYITFILLYTLYKYPQLRFVTDKGKNGHLRFNFIPAHGPFSIAWLLFFFFGIFKCQDIFIQIIASLTFMISVYYTRDDITFNSYWCYISNFMWFYVLFYVIYKKIIV
jgi:hypothetical protein